MTSVELLEYFRSLGACEPGLAWFEYRLSRKPEITPLELWKELFRVAHLDTDPKYKPPEGTHTGHGWIAWICKQVDIPCRNGTFSGMDKVKDGPHATAIDPVFVLAALEAKKAKK